MVALQDQFQRMMAGLGTMAQQMGVSYGEDGRLYHDGPGDMEVVFKVPIYGRFAGQTRFDRAAHRDRFGNVAGQEYDLSPDGAFRGDRILIMQFYTGEGFTFAEPKAELEKKGFSVTLLSEGFPTTAAAMRRLLADKCQLWIVSGAGPCQLRDEVIGEIERFVMKEKKGLYLWGDNDPYTVEANAIMARVNLFHHGGGSGAGGAHGAGEAAAAAQVYLQGNYHADQVVKENAEQGKAGFYNHLLTTGIENLYEGITISTVHGPARLRGRPIVRSSDNNIVMSAYEHEGARVLIDGGFTRLYPDRWSRTAGTARLVVNAACWLFNYEGRHRDSKHAPHGPGHEAPARAPKHGPDSGKLASRRRVGAAAQSEDASHILFPDSKVGLFLGKGGANISKLRSELGVDLHLDGKSSDGFHKLTITGSHAARFEAESTIRKRYFQ